MLSAGLMPDCEAAYGGQGGRKGLGPPGDAHDNDAHPSAEPRASPGTAASWGGSPTQRPGVARQRRLGGGAGSRAGQTVAPILVCPTFLTPGQSNEFKSPS